MRRYSSLRKNGRWWRSLTAMPELFGLGDYLSLYCAPGPTDVPNRLATCIGGGKTACADRRDPHVGDDLTTDVAGATAVDRPAD